MAETRASKWQAMGLGAAVACTLLLAMLASTPASAASTKEGQLLVPPSFQLRGTNGYTITVIGFQAHKDHAAGVDIFVLGKHSGVTYSAPATVTETSIQANLGALGGIAVTFHRSGLPTSAHSSCDKRPVRFDSGSFEGKIAFHGEEGYTEAEATSVPGNIDFLLNGVCGVFGGGGQPLKSSGELSIRNPGLGARFSVFKTRPGARARFEVGVSEYSAGISIERFQTLLLPAGSFTYDQRLQTATVKPPPPFAGTANFDRRKKANRRWSGDLTVEMPGRSDVPLTGAELRATLSRVR